MTSLNTSSELDNTADIVAKAGLRRRRIALGTLVVLLIAGSGAGIAAAILKQALDAANARAATAEASLAKTTDTVRSLQSEREELRGKIDRYERENGELLAAKTKLEGDVAEKDAALSKEAAARAELEDKLKAEIKSGDVAVVDDGGRVRVDFVDKVLFDSGDATIGKHGVDVLTKVGSVLANVQGKLIEVSGHTDDSPPAAKIKDAFPTNWELSTARATNVVRFLQEQAKIPGKRLVATGYGQFKPVATNANPTGRAKNRRIEILLVPDVAAVKSDVVAKAK